MSGRMRACHVLGFAVLLLLATTLSWATVVVAAALTSAPAAFLAAGWLMLALGVWGSARIVVAPRTRLRVAIITLALATSACAVSVIMPEDPSTPAPPAGMLTLELPSRARLAYVRITGAGAGEIPIVVLHGGPCTPNMRSDIRYLRPLVDAGFDVYLYDQTGCGRSTRLVDPTGYSMASAVTDLEAFRQAVGAARVHLLGFSWGATLSAAYLAVHPERVEKAVLVSPGAMIGGVSGPNVLLDRLDAGARWAVFRESLWPRALLAWTLVQVNPPAAHTFASDAEMDARFRRLSAAAEPALYCDPSLSDTPDAGFYAYAVLLRLDVAHAVDPHEALRHLTTPALVLKGSCDYLSWSSAVDYRDTLPAARMVYLPGAGHRLYAERPDAFVRTVAAFLKEQPLPFPDETRAARPPDYQGPP